MYIECARQIKSLSVVKYIQDNKFFLWNYTFNSILLLKKKHYIFLYLNPEFLMRIDHNNIKYSTQDFFVWVWLEERFEIPRDVQGYMISRDSYQGNDCVYRSRPWLRSCNHPRQPKKVAHPLSVTLPSLVKQLPQKIASCQ